MATPAPRYDEIFFEGVEWLDGLAVEAGLCLEGDADYDYADEDE